MPNTTALSFTVGGHQPDEKMHLLEGMDIYEGAWGDKDRGFEQIRSGMVNTWNLYTEHIIPEFTPLSNQGRAGTCVANAWCDAVEMLIGLRDGKECVVQLSRRFAYWISRYLHNATDKEKGTFLRAMGHQFRKVGVILEEVMPYSDELDMLVGKKASPELEHYTMASNNRIKGFYRLGAGGEQMLKEAEIAVRSDHPVVFGVPVSHEFTRARGLHVFGPPDDVAGNHCMIVTGVRFINAVRQWLIRNSWGKWGLDGHCWITDPYLALSDDTWVGTMLERLI